jgi:hypothetical protein
LGEEDSDGYFLFNVELGEVLSASFPFHFQPSMGEIFVARGKTPGMIKRK